MSNLGVLVDSQLSMADHVVTLSRECLFQLRQLRLMRLSLTVESANTLVHAFVSSHLDYCNSLRFVIRSGLIRSISSLVIIDLQP